MQAVCVSVGNFFLDKVAKIVAKKHSIFSKKLLSWWRLAWNLVFSLCFHRSWMSYHSVGYSFKLFPAVESQWLECEQEEPQFSKTSLFPQKSNIDELWWLMNKLAFSSSRNGGACMPLRITRGQCTGLSLSLLSSLTRTIYYLHHQKKVSKTQRNSKLLLRRVFRDFLSELPTLACVL